MGGLALINYSIVTVLASSLVTTVCGSVVKKSKASGNNTLSTHRLQLPLMIHSRLPLIEREHFSPSTGTGREQIPDNIRDVLIPALSPNVRPPGIPDDDDDCPAVTARCNSSKILVQVRRSSLGAAGGSPSQLTLGTCQASKITEELVYFDYDIGLCGDKPTIINNRLAYTNILRYDPPTPTGPIRRTAPFSLSISCHYNRYMYNYKIGYTPKMEMHKVFKPMKNRVKFVLTARNAQWERLSPMETYVLGKRMYFQIEAPSMSITERLYVQSCHATHQKSHTAKPQYPVIENSGCMVESKEGHSSFIPYQNNAVRFSVDAFLLKGMTGKVMFMHCAVSVESSVPTSTAKSCNYNTTAGRWEELYGPASVCSCCKSKCSSTASAETKMVRSKAWWIERKVEPTAAPMRKTTTSTLTATMARKRKTTSTTMTTTEMTTTTRNALAITKKTAMVDEELEWPYGVGGVRWKEAEGIDRRVKGSAVVEEVTKPRRIFEDIFGLNK